MGEVFLFITVLCMLFWGTGIGWVILAVIVAIVSVVYDLATQAISGLMSFVLELAGVLSKPKDIRIEQSLCVKCGSVSPTLSRYCPKCGKPKWLP